MTTFGAKLRALMAERQISQRKLAKLVPCNDGHLSKLANDRKRPSPNSPRGSTNSSTRTASWRCSYLSVPFPGQRPQHV